MAFSWLSYAMVKLTIEADQKIYEWEYENPLSFEYEEGDRIIRGKEAKQSFERVIQSFNLAKKRITEEEIVHLEKEMMIHINRVVLRLYDRNFNHAVFVWEKET